MSEGEKKPSLSDLVSQREVSRDLKSSAGQISPSRQTLQRKTTSPPFFNQLRTYTSPESAWGV